MTGRINLSDAPRCNPMALPGPPMMADYDARKALSAQRTIDRCVRLLDQGIEHERGTGSWYFDQAREVIAERDGGLTICQPDPLRKVAL